MYNYRIIDNEVDMNLVYKLRCNVYCDEKHWLERKLTEKDAYDEHAIHFGAFDEDGQLVGYVRLVFAKEGLDLPIEKVFGKLFPVDMKTTEITRLIIPKDKRGLQIVSGLFRILCAWCIENKLSRAYAVVQEVTLKLLNRKGYPFEQIGEGNDYYGFYNIPICLAADRYPLAKYSKECCSNEAS